MRKKGTVLQSFITALELPQELAVNEPFITAIGSNLITIENYQTLIQYTTDEIKLKIILKAKSGTLKIAGKNMTIKEIETGKISICGDISNIAYNN